VEVQTLSARRVSGRDPDANHGELQVAAIERAQFSASKCDESLTADFRLKTSRSGPACCGYPQI
jgi:hypothetical protein